MLYLSYSVPSPLSKKVMPETSLVNPLKAHFSGTLQANSVSLKWAF